MLHECTDGTYMIHGYVTRAPRLVFVGEDNVPACTVGLLIGHADKDQKIPIFKSVKAWRDKAIYLSECEKGDSLFAIGKIEPPREYKGVVYQDIRCDYISLQPKSKGIHSSTHTGNFETPDGMTLVEDEELPF